MATINHERRNKLDRKESKEVKKEYEGIKAKYNGTCIICTESILKGEMIGKFDYGKAYHTKCL